MDAIGGQEMLLPALHPAELWQESGRWDVMGDNMFRLKDRFGRPLCLGMTHEEVMTVIARGELRSYKQLPQIWYQIQTKFRDEPRPKSGLLRVRQFIMKDSYSFDMDKAGLDAAYDKHYKAYCRIFDRCGLEYVAVEAHSGAMGGSQSHEFMVASDAGEDFVVSCPKTGYAANLEKAVSRPVPPAIADPEGDLTPGEVPYAESQDDRGSSGVHGSARNFADEEPGDDGGRQARARVCCAATIRLSETKFADVTGGKDIRPAHPEEIRTAFRRRCRLARPGRREEHAHHRRPCASGPPQHDRGRKRERLPPEERHSGRGLPG